jgi:hypothetical protein
MTPRTEHLRHQALCVTDDEDAAGAALALVLSDPAMVLALVGPDSELIVELMPLPAELDGRLVPGTTSISLAVDDLEARVAACHAAGLDVSIGIGAGNLPYAVVSVAGLEFELVGWPPS